MNHELKIVKINELKIQLLDREATTIDLINELIAIHFESHKDCDYSLSCKSTRATDHHPLSSKFAMKKVVSVPPRITVTKTISIED